jgi:hypothetical protein
MQQKTNLKMKNTEKIILLCCSVWSVLNLYLFSIANQKEYLVHYSGWNIVYVSDKTLKFYPFTFFADVNGSEQFDIYYYDISEFIVYICGGWGIYLAYRLFKR